MLKDIDSGYGMPNGRLDRSILFGKPGNELLGRIGHGRKEQQEGADAPDEQQGAEHAAKNATGAVPELPGGPKAGRQSAERCQEDQKGSHPQGFDQQNKDHTSNCRSQEIEKI